MSGAHTPKILLVVGGGIAAYKSCELVRLIRKGGAEVTCVITKGGQQFVTPMTLAALSENPVHTTLWDLKNEAEMGHIQLSREADLVVVCPATADLMAKMATGIADDLATTLILATDKPVMAVPAMNVRMWQHEATQRNAAWLREAGVHVVDPDIGPMACGEFGPGRLPDPEVIWAEIAAILGINPAAAASVPGAGDAEEIESEARGGLGGLLSSLIPRTIAKIEEGSPGESGAVIAAKGAATSAPPTDPEATNHTVKTGAGAASPQPIAGDVQPVSAAETDPLEGQPDFEIDPEHRPLYGKHVLITAGPTREAIDPVRYIANRSSGKQGYAIAAAAAVAGARVTLVSGPVWLDTPPGVDRIDVESAREMAAAVKEALPADAAIMVAAVSDWRSKDTSEEKIKKRGSAPPALMLTENPDILATTASGGKRPPLLIGFAAETENVIENAKAKRKRKGVDWIVANDVSWADGKSVMGGADNRVHIVTSNNVESLDTMPKADVARALIERVAEALNTEDDDE